MAKERDEFWRRAFAALVNIAKGWTENAADREDLAQKALTEAWMATPEETDAAALVRRAAWIMRGHLSHERRARKRRQKEEWVGAAVETSRGLRRTPEQIAATRQNKEHLLGRLREHLADDPDATALLDATLQDHTTAAEQADALGWDIGRVRNARKRLDRAVQAVEDEVAPESGRGWEDAAEASEAAAQDEGDSGVES
jgi:DNA-directed RNA polymerase specialized sigma24 family protein